MHPALSETTFAVVDVETTGLNPHAGDRVCEVAVVRSRGGQEVDRFVTLVDPSRPLSRRAAEVNGLCDAELRGQPAFAAVAGAVAARLAGAVLVAHNAPFDLSFLDHEFMRLGYPTLDNLCVDTLQLARACYHRLPSYSLERLAHRLGLADGVHHRALADVLATHGLLHCLIRDLPARSLADLRPTRASLPTQGSVPTCIQQALRERRPLFLRYRSAEGLTERLVEPLAVETRDRALYLVAYCHLRGERRTFRLDRIVMMEVRE